MVRKVLISALVLLSATSAAWAQQPKVEFTGLIGWTFSDGVTGDPFKAPDGNTYDRIDPVDSVNFGFSVGFFVTPSAELGFLWRRQASQAEVSGTNTVTLGDWNIDGYHGYGAYYFGDPEGKARPYILFGLGATNIGGLEYTRGDGTNASFGGNTQFSTTWGVGLKVNASPNVGMKFGLQWTPTYIKSDAEGWWCDPWWGCYVIGDAQYANQFEFIGGIAFRF